MNPQQALDQRIQRSGVILMLVAVLMVLTAFRNNQRQNWLLEPPLVVGAWSLSETPLSDAFLGRINYPKTKGFVYKNPLDEIVTCQLIATQTFEAYREPDEFQMLQISAQRSIPLFGPDKPVRAWILKVPREEGRMMVYAWLQTQRGTTQLFGERGLRQSFLERVSISGKGLLFQEPQCLVRLYTILSPDDKEGVQARRSMDQLAKAIYQNNVKGEAR